MFDKLKSLKRKKEAKIEKKDNTLIKVIIISSILGLFTMFITSSFLSFILIIICSIISYFIIYPQKMNDDKEEKIRAKFSGMTQKGRRLHRHRLFVPTGRAAPKLILERKSLRARAESVCFRCRQKSRQAYG